MKKILTLILVALLVTLTVIPAFAAEVTQVPQDSTTVAILATERIIKEILPYIPLVLVIVGVYFCRRKDK